MQIPIASIQPHPLNESIYGEITEEDVADLIQSIEDVGLLEPIVINSRNQCISGHRRLQACRFSGMESIECSASSMSTLISFAIPLPLDSCSVACRWSISWRLEDGRAPPWRSGMPGSIQSSYTTRSARWRNCPVTTTQPLSSTHILRRQRQTNRAPPAADAGEPALPSAHMPP